MNTNLYELLEVDPSSDLKTIKKSFFKKIKSAHPDKTENPPTNKQSSEVQKAMDLILAYKILSDPETRKEYDMGLLYSTGKSNAWKENRFCLNMYFLFAIIYHFF